MAPYGEHGGGELTFVQRTPELARVAALPRRTWTKEAAAVIVADMTRVLKRPEGTQELFPLQAVSLYEIAILKGLFAPMSVGSGKSLVTFLAPWVLNAQRPMLLLPANLVDKTKRDMFAYSKHWLIPNNIRIESYEQVSRVSSEEMFKAYRPDLIMADEVQKLRDPSTATTRRVKEWMSIDPSTMFIGLSGTIANHSMKDYSHLLMWALKRANNPFPNGWSELEMWAAALDEKPAGGERRVSVGALIDLASEEDRAAHFDDVDVCRVAVRRRMTETPGVVASHEQSIGTSLTVSSWVLDVPEVEEHVKKLLLDAETPGGEMLMEAIVIWQRAREIVLGFSNRWDPPAPPEWKERRKEWASLCRYILGSNQRSLFSELQVKNAIDTGYYPDAAPVLQAWREIMDTFIPNPVPIWLTERVVEAVAERIQHRPQIVWTEHTCFAEKLSRLSGIPYFGELGLDPNGNFIDDADPRRSIIASIHANMMGRNLQAWHHNLFTSIHPNGSRMEQAIGRTHRFGQKADNVSVEILFAGGAHVNAWDKVLDNARYLHLTTGAPQKILYADNTVDIPHHGSHVYRWRTE